MLIADGAGPDPQNGEDIDPFQDLHPQEDIEDHRHQGEEDPDHRHPDAHVGRDQNLLTRRNLSTSLIKTEISLKWKRR